jgi:5-formyltetrahydrofolate cyclo-ligase
MWHPPAKQVTEDEYTDGQCGRCRFFYFAREDCMPHSSTGVFDAGTSGNLDAAKAACRRQAVVRRAQLADALPDAATMLAGHAARLTSRYGSGVFAGYIPIHSELSPLALLKNLAGLGCYLALPITPQGGQPLRFHCWEIDGLLNDGPYGTKQPPADNEKCNPDVILAPLLAFDLDGRRLGYGGGFYDRTVASLRGFGQRVKLIGVAYEEQKVDKVPVGPFDMPLDAVLSPAGISEFEPSRKL